MTSDDRYDLQRFMTAQAPVFETLLAELRAGRNWRSSTASDPGWRVGSRQDRAFSVYRTLREHHAKGELVPRD
jgi:hypothetical protein